MKSLSDYTFHVERFEDNYSGLIPIFKENHAETGIFDLAFDPDFDRYVSIEKAGGLAFFVVRKVNKVVGYAGFFMNTAIQQKDVITATQSFVFVTKAHRGISLSFLRYCDEMLKAGGAACVYRQSSAKRDIEKIYVRMGYRLIEKTFRKDF